MQYTTVQGGGERQRERERVGDQDKDGWWMDAHGWPAQARNGGCPVKALAVGLFWRLNPQYMKIAPST